MQPLPAPMYAEALAAGNGAEDSRLICLKCHGRSVRKFSILHDESRSTTSSSTTGSAAGEIGFGFSAQSRGHIASGLARRTAPPERKHFSYAFFWETKRKQEEEARFQAAVAEWEQRYLCLQCGTVMLVRDMDTPPEIAESDEPYLDALIRERQKIRAVKYVCDRFGLELPEALKQVDARARELGCPF